MIPHHMDGKKIEKGNKPVLQAVFEALMGLILATTVSLGLIVGVIMSKDFSLVSK